MKSFASVLVAGLSIALLPAPSAAALDGAIVVHVAPGAPVTLPLGPGEGLLLARPLGSTATVEWKSEAWSGAHSSSTFGAWQIDGDDVASMRTLGAFSGQFVFAASATLLAPSGPVVVAARPFGLGSYSAVNGTIHPGGPRATFAAGVLNDAGRVWTIESDEPVDVTLFVVPFSFRFTDDWPATAGAEVATIGGGAMAHALGAVTVEAGGHMFAHFTNTGGPAGVALDRVSGPGYDQENLHVYAIEDGAPGAWRFESTLAAGAGFGMGTVLWAADLPDF